MNNFDLKKYLAEGRLIKEEASIEDNQRLLARAGINTEEGVLGGVGSGGAGYYDFLSDKISGFNLDGFDEEMFNKWYDTFNSKEDFNKVTYDQDEWEGEEIDASILPKGIHQLEGGSAEVTDDRISLYAYPTLAPDNQSSEDMIEIFKLDQNGQIVSNVSKEETKSKLVNNDYSII